MPESKKAWTWLAGDLREVEVAQYPMGPAGRLAWFMRAGNGEWVRLSESSVFHNSEDAALLWRIQQREGFVKELRDEMDDIQEGIEKTQREILKLRARRREVGRADGP